MSAKRWVAWALGASVLLNVFALGAVVGLAGAGVRLSAGQGSPASVMRDRTMLSILQELPAADRRAALRTALRERREVRDQLRAAEAARAEVYALLTAPQFDPEATRAAIAHAREADAALLARGHEVLIDVLSRTEDADRIAAVEAARDRAPRPEGEAGRPFRGQGDRPWRRPPPPEGETPDPAPPPPEPGGL